ncbi:hypothetical protein EJB05_02315, partial [Eragrostis curvula]
MLRIEATLSLGLTSPIRSLSWRSVPRPSPRPPERRAYQHAAWFLVIAGEARLLQHTAQDWNG